MNKPLLTHKQIQEELDYRRSIYLVGKMKGIGLISAEEEDAIRKSLLQQFPPYLAEIWPKSLAISGS